MGVYFGSYRGLVGIHAEGILLFIGNNRGLYVGKLLDLVGFFCGYWGLFYHHHCHYIVGVFLVLPRASELAFYLFGLFRFGFCGFVTVWDPLYIYKSFVNLFRWFLSCFFLFGGCACVHVCMMPISSLNVNDDL